MTAIRLEGGKHANIENNMLSPRVEVRALIYWYSGSPPFVRVFYVRTGAIAGPAGAGVIAQNVCARPVSRGVMRQRPLTPLTVLWSAPTVESVIV